MESPRLPITIIVQSYTYMTMSNLLSLTSNQLKRAAAIKDLIEGLNQVLASLLGSAAPAPKAAAKAF